MQWYVLSYFQKILLDQKYISFKKTVTKCIKARIQVNVANTDCEKAYMMKKRYNPWMTTDDVAADLKRQDVLL